MSGKNNFHDTVTDIPQVMTMDGIRKYKFHIVSYI